MPITNNRVLCFLAAHQLTEADIVRKQEDEQRTVTIGGETLPWTVHFVSWNSRHLREWAASLGFTRDYRLALVGEDGHDAYDSWLRTRYPY